MHASISSVSSSDFMIVWQSQGQDIIGGSDWGVYGQRFTSSGIKIGNEFRVNTYLINDQSSPSIGSLDNDNYIVIWQSNLQDGSGLGIYGQIFDSTGNKSKNEFQVNTFTNYNQKNPSVSSMINTNFVVVWDGYGQNSYQFVFGNFYQDFIICPPNCQSCDNITNCKVCNLYFKLEPNGLCGCLDGNLLDISTNMCISNLI